MPTNQVKIIGAAELTAKFAQLNKVTQVAHLKTAVLAGLLPIQNEAIDQCPVLEGNLVRSIHSEIVTEQDGYAEGFTGTDVEYARRIEFGFDDMTDSLGRTYHQKPQPYMRPAYDTKRPEAIKEVGDVLKLLIEQV